MRRLLKTYLLTLLSVGVHAAETPLDPQAHQPEYTPAKPTIKNLGGSRHQLGKITFDNKLRTIEFDGTLEQNEILVEYLLVNPHGKIHESVFTSDILPFNLNLAMKLLGFKESKQLLPILDKNHVPTGKFHQATPEQKRHSRFTISVSWDVDGKKVTHDAHTLIGKVNTSKTLSPAPWIYSGSYVLAGQFKADLSGDIFAIFTDSGSIANYSGEGRDDDTLWVANKKILPPYGTPVHITLKQINSTD